VWQSQAFGGTAKDTAVEGCEAFAKADRGVSDKAAAPASTSRRVIEAISSYQNLTGVHFTGTNF
jgi:hypothetical protein